MKWFLSVAAIVAAIIFGPLVTDWITAPDPEQELINSILYGDD